MQKDQTNGNLFEVKVLFHPSASMPTHNLEIKSSSQNRFKSMILYCDRKRFLYASIELDTRPHKQTVQKLLFERKKEAFRPFSSFERYYFKTMGTAQPPAPVRFFCAIMHSPDAPWKAVLSSLIAEFGPVECVHGPVPFTFSTYYESEMGPNLLKRYYTFERLIDRSDLPRIKNLTNSLEDRYCSSGQRQINLDPGYLARDKLVLASTKDFYHRLYLDKGIYAETTLHYQNGGFRIFSWTYADYKEQELWRFLEKSRAELVFTLRNAQRAAIG